MPEKTLQPRRTRARLIIVTGLLLAVAAVALLRPHILGPGDDRVAGPAEDAVTTAPDDEQRTEDPAPDPFRRADGSAAYRPAVHLTPEQRWMNDPQRPFFLDGQWHYYYLYNADYPEGNGTEWYHATSTDLVHWVDQGVAIGKYQNGLGDIWTGTAVVDQHDTAGFGAGAVVALVTQQVDGVQRQSLFVSRDGGFTFESFEGNPVMDNPGVDAWRDPRVIWDDARDQWVMALAEGDRIGFYTSANLRDWTYASDFSAPGLGVLECPDLFPMAVDGNQEDVRWVLLTGANGAADGMTTGTAYWTGTWDGQSFAPDDERHQWLDRGPDYYAAVTWSDPRLTPQEQLAGRYSIGWLNNWAYAGSLPTEEWHGGSASVVRELSLRGTEDGPMLTSMPVDSLAGLEGPAQSAPAVSLDAGGSTTLGTPAADAYRLRVVASAPEPDAELRLRIEHEDGTFSTVGYDFAAGQAFVARDADAAAAQMPPTYREISTADVAPVDGQVELDVVVDVASVEAFVNQGQAALSMLSYGDSRPSTPVAYAERGTVELREISVTPLRVAEPTRTG